MTKKQQPKTLCPACGWDVTEHGQHDFGRYLEEVVSVRRIDGHRNNGTLQVCGEESIGLEDPGTNGRLQCGQCMHDFPVPDGLEIEWV